MRIHIKIILSTLIFIVLLGVTPSFVIEAAGKLSEDSSIANVPVEGLTVEEAKMRLQEEIVNWYGGEDLIGESDYESIKIPRKNFEFDIDASIKNLEEQTKRHWSTFFMKKKNVHVPLTVNINETVDLPEHINAEKLLSDASQVASQLGEEVISIEYKENTTIDTEVIASTEFGLPNISEATILHIINQLNGLAIPADTTFSFIDSITLLGSLENAEEETSFIGSAIYAAALKSNLEIIERHSLGEVPSYTEAGMEAEVNYEENKDLKLYNPNSFPITIYAEVYNGELTLDLESVPFEGKSDVFIGNRVEVDPKTITRYSPDLSAGEKQWIQSGEDGLQIEVYRTITDENGVEERDLVARDYYPPKPSIVVVSTKEEAVPETDNLTELPELTEQFTPERLISSYMIEQGNVDSTDSNAASSDEILDLNNDSSTSQLLFACMLEGMQGDTESSEDEEMEENEEGNEEVVDETELSYCDLLGLLMLAGLFDDQNTTKETKEVKDEEEEVN